MALESVLAIAMFGAAILALLSGFPVAFVLGGTALLFAGLGIGLGVFYPSDLRAVSNRIQGVMENQVLVAVPLFILMGTILERSRIAEDLLGIASRLLSGLRGGLGLAVIGVGALLAASTGIVGATVVTMTLIALPAMLRQGYDPALASGTIAASGTLGQIIPPSIVLILLADAVTIASQAASQQTGEIGGAVSVGDLFAGALIPGLVLVGLFMAWMLWRAFTDEDAAPAAPAGRMGSEANADADVDTPLTAARIAYGLGAPLALILVVLGSILAGIAPPTEAAAIGVAGALLLAGLRLAPGAAPGWQWLVQLGLGSALALLLFRGLADEPLGRALLLGLALLLFAGLAAALRIMSRAREAGPALSSAVTISAMVFTILIGASLFSLVFAGFYGDELVAHWLASVPGGRAGALAAALLVMFLLGFFLDFIEIVFIVVPLVAPPLIVAGYDPVWLAITMALVLQTSFLTPPFGFALFYLRGSAPDDLPTATIWRGALPFIALQLTVLALVIALPSLATWLPGRAG